MNIAGKNAKIDLGTSSKAIDSLSQPLGRITGQADQFGKSMEAANARVLAFGASVGIMSAVTRGFKEMISTTIQVEKSLADINSVLGANSTQLNKFKNDIFSVAKETGNSFQTVSEAALELSRQGLKSDEVLRRLKDSMILARLSGMDATNSVEGLTAAVNSFSKTGITTTEVLNKIAKTAAAYSVSEKDLIEGFKRSASVAQQAGVSLDELGGIITAVQEKTARGGAVIGNAFKTIFTRIQRPESLAALQEVGAAVTDMQGGILPATKLIENLAQKMNSLNDIQKANITEKIGGGFQIGPLLAALDDLNSKTSTFRGATEAMATAGGEAYARNTALNKTLAASINEATINLQELANTLGEIGVTDSLKNILSFFSSLTTNIKDLLQGEGIGSDLAKGIIKGISGIITGPGFVIFGAIIAKLTYGLVTFGTESLKAFFGIGQAQKEINALASSLTNTLMNNANIHKAVLSLEGNHVAQATLLGTILKQNNAEMQRFVEMGTRLAPGVASVVKGGGRNAAGGYMPAVAQENSDIQRGIGGASPSNRPVVIPNFAFGGGKVGTMVANDGEYVVNNYGGSGGSAIFNKDMVSKIGLPSNAQKINAAGGFIPNFAATSGVWEEDLARFQRGGITRPQLSSRYGKDIVDSKLGSSVKSTSKSLSSTLNIDANALGGLGVVSVSGGQGSVDTSEGRGQMSASEVEFLDKSFGKDKIQKVIMSNIQSRSLGILDSTLKMNNQEAFRARVKEKFTSPLVDMGSELIGRTFKGNDKADLVSQLSAKKNDPALFSESVLGGIFESAIRVATKSAKEIGAFKDVDANAAFDFEESGSADKEFKNAFGFGDNLYKADAKKTANPKTIQTIIGKALRDREVGSRIQSSYSSQAASQIAARGASGYIPNFANALNEAVSREVNAGVNPSQVYVDQNSSLKNSANPMGLMVANRRDEPSGGWKGIDRARKEGADVTAYGAARGFIPNFANDNSSYAPTTAAFVAATTSATNSLNRVADSGNKIDKGQKDHLGTIFAVQLAMSGLSAAFGDATSGAGLFAKRLADAGSSITTAVFAMQSLQKIGTEGSKLSGVMGKLGTVGMVAAIAFEGFNLIKDLWRDTTGVTEKANKATAEFKDAVDLAGVSLKNLSSLEKVVKKQEAGDIIYNLRGGMKPGAFESASGKEKFQNEMFDFQRLSGISGSGKESQKLISDILIKGGAAKKDYTYADERRGPTIQSGEHRGTREFLNINEDLAPKVMAAYLASSEGQKEINRLKEEDKKKTEETTAAVEKGRVIEQLNFDIVKNKIKSELEIATLKARQKDSIDRQLSSAQILGNVSEDQIRSLEKQAALRDQDRSTSDDIKGILLGQLDSSKALFADTEKFKAIKETILGLSTDELLNDGLRNELLKNFSILNDDVTNTTVEKNKGEIEALKAINNLKKQGLETSLNQKQTDFDSLKIMKDAVSAAQELTAKKSFQTNYDAQSAIYAKDARKNEIDRVLAAGNLSESAIRKLNAEKAGLDAEKASLGVTVSQSNLLQKAKDQLLGTKASEGLGSTTISQQAAKSNSVEDVITQLRNPMLALNADEAKKRSELANSLEREKQSLDQSSTANIAAAKSAADLAGILPGVTSAFTQMENAFSPTAIQQGAENAKFAAMTETSGRKLAELKYIQETAAMQDKKPPEEAARIARERSVKGVGQKFTEAFSETESDRMNRMSDSLVSGAEKFRDTMIDGMSKVIEEGGSLGDVLRSAALDFAREMTKTSMKNMFSSLTSMVGASIPKYASGGKISGGSGTKDDVPAMLMGGEYVINKGAVSKYGTSFIESLNNGTLSHFASGGKVNDSKTYQIRSGGIGSDVSSEYSSTSKNLSNSGPTQTGVGGFYMPGLYNQGKISGKNDLLSYATQAYTSGAGDVIKGGADYSSIDLEGESMRLTNFGRTHGRLADAIAQSKGQSFDLYKGQLEQEKQIKEAEKAKHKALVKSLQTMLITSVASAGLGAVGGAMSKGFINASQASAKTGASWLSQMGAGAKGIFSGGDIGGGLMGGGLKNLFTGNLSLSQMNSSQLMDYLKKDPSGAFAKNLQASNPNSFAGGQFIPTGSLVKEMGVSNRSEFQNPYFEQRGDIIPNIPLGRATGGSIPQMAGTDTVPAMLSGGEFIMNQAATQKIGPSNLNAMNSGASDTGKDSKELNDKLISKLDELIAASKESGKGVTVNVASDGKTESTDEGASEKDKNLSMKIKAAVIKVINEEKRLGGVLRRSNG
jgi:TP901 family phage tail tape measure protein